ncbi:hypothetical protein SPRG_05976 [Saprolegnia parasitica CBS 223.65]|uniref:chitinase n=1 Tax=Saprolegnia parasitica (strain CBS 223.65) TaxID=695850 RepID=A0A067CF95_SAPPC|nr:hypothetical protein SPRG_05976 [Saprolegnia parasitica CBS 223.65]KDO29439.1 hypothetical protein SPRG_05976 [Saprolegnia parasitica CBS 223.65]|eukprot:XP_012199939.1 hypothetical protein SPRG_05976 [Saprolegnia parasitica CBS 223.65]
MVSKDWDVVIVAFGTNQGNGNVGFELDKDAGSEAAFIEDIAALQARGKKVVLSLGGQDGSVSLANDMERHNFVNSVHGLLRKYGFDGIDLDLESGISQGLPIIDNLIVGVKELRRRVGDSFYLSMAPEHPYVQGGYGAYGSIWGAYLPIIDGLRNELSIIHVQYYNNGGFVYTDGRMINEGTVDCLVGGSLMLMDGFRVNYGQGWKFNGLRPDQVAFGVPSGPQAAGRGFVTPTTVARALTCLAHGVGCDTIKPKNTYPTFRGVMTWSINWDRFDRFAFSQPVRHALDSLGHNDFVAPVYTATTTQEEAAAPETTPEPTQKPKRKPGCGDSTGCYYAPTSLSLVGWSAQDCGKMPFFLWCGP